MCYLIQLIIVLDIPIAPYSVINAVCLNLEYKVKESDYTANDLSLTYLISTCFERKIHDLFALDTESRFMSWSSVASLLQILWIGKDLCLQCDRCSIEYFHFQNISIFVLLMIVFCSSLMIEVLVLCAWEIQILYP